MTVTHPKNMNVISKIIRAVRHERDMRRAPLRVEFVLSDYCNLNCKGCTHYSPLAPKEFEPLETLSRTMSHIGQVAGKDISKAYLIGGETLLYPHLEEAMSLLRKNFPTQELYIFTNGLMIPRMSDSFWDSARNNDIIVVITRYPIKFDYDSAIELCRSKGVRTEVFADRSETQTFFRYALDPKGCRNRSIAHLKCDNRGCLSVIGDKLYPCSISGCVKHLNNAFATKFEHRPGDWLNVEDIRSAADIRRLRDNPVPFCSYCILPPKSVSHSPSQRKIEEWVENS